MTTSIADEKKEQRTTVIPLANCALSQAEESACEILGSKLLSETGPLAAYRKARERGVLDALQRVAKQGKGVVFEADMVARTNGAAERFGHDVSAQFAPSRNNPNYDMRVRFGSNRYIDYQLKAGTEAYLRRSSRYMASRSNRELMLVQADAPQELLGETVCNAVSIRDDFVPCRTVDELEEMAQRGLLRVVRGCSAVDYGSLLKKSLYFGLIDALTSSALDLFVQMHMNESPIDWERTKAVFGRRLLGSSLVGTLAGLYPAWSLDGLDTADACLRRSYSRIRVGTLLVPRLVDAIEDWRQSRDGLIDKRLFHRRLCRNAGGFIGETAAFWALSRCASRMGVFGQFLVLFGGGLVANWLGSVIGEQVFESLYPGAPLPAIEPAVDSNEGFDLETAGSNLVPRRNITTRRLCEEPCCERVHYARGYCVRHYHRWYRRNRRFLTLIHGRLVPIVPKAHVGFGSISLGQERGR